jgi:hypothetical protein
MEDLILHEQKHVSILDNKPKALVAEITAMADVLSDVINKQKMFIDLSGKKYVTVEAWNTLGTMLNILPAEKDVKKLDNGWEAKVELINRHTGVVVGGASAICTREEKSWSTRPDFALRSMAITRATGKAYRLGFSWVIKMAGYEATPAEEMTIEVTNNDSNSTRSNKTSVSQKKNKIAEYRASEANSSTETAAPTYDRTNEKHQAAISKKLEAKEIPFEFWDKIGDALHGRPTTDFEAVILEVVQ